MRHLHPPSAFPAGVQRSVCGRAVPAGRIRSTPHSGRTAGSALSMHDVAIRDEAAEQAFLNLVKISAPVLRSGFRADSAGGRARWPEHESGVAG